MFKTEVETVGGRAPRINSIHLSKELWSIEGADWFCVTQGVEPTSGDRSF